MPDARDDHDEDEADHSAETGSSMGCLSENPYVLQALEQAKQMLDCFSLQTFPDSIAHSAEVLVSAAFCGASRTQELAFSCLCSLSSRKHGPLDNGFMQVLKSMAPWLLEIPTAAVGASALASISKKAVDFVAEYLDSIGVEDDLLTAQKYVCVLYQQLCIRIVEKAPLRAQASSVISGLVEVLIRHGGKAAIDEVISFLRRYARNSKPAFRLFGVEMASVLLIQNRLSDAEAQSAADIAIIGILEERASDKMPGVRAKSLTCIASAMQYDAVSDAFRLSMSSEVSDKRTSLSASMEVEPDGGAAAVDSSAAGPSCPEVEAAEAGGSFLETVKRRCLDGKSAVRKAAVQVMETHALSLLRRGRAPAEEDVEAMRMRCSDASVLVRKQALDSITAVLLAYEGRERLQSICEMWARSCLPLVRDQEQAVQERAISVVQQLLLQPLASTSAKSRISPLTETLLQSCDELCKPYLQFASRALCRRKPTGLPAGLVRRIMQLWRDAADGAEMPLSVWWIVEEIAEQQVSAVDFALLVQKYEGGADMDRLAALRTLGKVSAHVPEQIARPFSAKLLKGLERQDHALRFVHDVLGTAVRLAHASDRKAAGGNMPDWALPLLASAERIVEKQVQRRLSSKGSEGGRVSEDPSTPQRGEGGADRGTEELIRAVYLVGEVSMLSCSRCSTRLSNSVQALLTPTGPAAQSDLREDRKELELQGHVLVALGKMSLQEPALAKKCVCLFLRELESTPSAVIRNNVLVVLTDLCVRYTSLVDPHIPKLALCLRDPSDLVRQHALVLITTLLCTDYVKWKGQLFFRYLLALVDEAALIREQAQQCLLRVLHPKSGHQICFVYLVEALFVLNDNGRHPSYNRFPSTPEERARFALPGAGANAGRRRDIYAMLLSHCTDEQRFQVTSKLCEEVLGAVADGALPLDDCHDVLEDALHVLASKEIRLSAAQRFGAGAGGDECPDEEGAGGGGAAAGPAAATAAARSKLLSQVARRNVMQNVVPTLAALKHVLERARSPLIGPLMRSLAQVPASYSPAA